MFDHFSLTDTCTYPSSGPPISNPSTWVNMRKFYCRLRFLLLLCCTDQTFYFTILCTPAVPESVANRSQCGDLNFKTFHPDFSDAPLHFSCGLCSLIFSRVFYFSHRDRCKGDSLNYLKYRCSIKQTSAAPTSYSKVNTPLIWQWNMYCIYCWLCFVTPQVKKKILEEEIHCPPEASVLLASYAVHAKVSASLFVHLHIYAVMIFWLCSHTKGLLGEFRE